MDSAMRRVTSVQFRGVDIHAKFKSVSKGVYAPLRARVDWLDGSVDEGALRLLNHRSSRDVFVLENFGYVLKLQEAQWET